MTAGPHPEIRRYQPLIGTWRTRGELLGEDSDPIAEIKGRDLYDWLGEAFVVHRVDVEMGRERVQTVEMIGPYSPDEQGFVTRAYGHDGEEQASMSRIVADRLFTFGADGARVRMEIAEDGRTAAAELDRQASRGAPPRRSGAAAEIDNRLSI